jgi:small subunit ribosomal protein S20
MANIKSAQKRIRQDAKRTERNTTRRTRMRTFVKRVEIAIETGDQAAANAALRLAQSELQHCAQRGVIKRNNASRKVSRLNARIKALATA